MGENKSIIMIETIFYFFGALFFLTWFLLLAIVLFFSIKVLRRIISIETEIKKTIIEAKGAIGDVRNKVVSFSISLAGIGALLEKLVEIKNKSRKKGNKESETPQKTKKSKKFAEAEEQL